MTLRLALPLIALFAILVAPSAFVGHLISSRIASAERSNDAYMRGRIYTWCLDPAPVGCGRTGFAEAKDTSTMPSGSNGQILVSSGYVEPDNGFNTEMVWDASRNRLRALRVTNGIGK